MVNKIGMFFFFLLVFTAMVCAEKKARVTTESGKKWDVVFLRMSNDTIYLKARKPNGAVFHISGHKSKFKKVEFTDGSLLDFGLSNFPPVESPSKTRDIGEWSGDSLFRSPGYSVPVLINTSPAPAGSPATDSSKAAAQSPPAHEPKPDTLTSAGKISDTLIAPIFVENTVQTAGPKADSSTEAILFVETTPSKASIEIDARPVEGVSPLTIRHLKIGKHQLRVSLDSLEASMTVSLVPWKIKQVKLQLTKKMTAAKRTVAPVVTERKKHHAVAFSLCALSVAALAGSGISYYFYLDDHNKAQDSKTELQQATVNGGPARALLETNKREHDKAQQRKMISQFLLGVGAACLGIGIVLYF